MSYPTKLLRNGLIASTFAFNTAAPAFATTAPNRGADCFFITQWQGWKSPSPNVIYLGVNQHDVYRVDLSAGSTMLDAPDVHLVSIVRGSDSICSALDLQLSVADTNGFKEPLIAKSLVKLTPAEIAAIPKKYRPN
jgi:hypothetical protein